MFRGYNPSAKGPGGSSVANAPRGYVAGRGRGAAGFQTRSDLGIIPDSGVGGGPSGAGANSKDASNPWGAAPKGYVAGAGRGASKMGAGAVIPAGGNGAGGPQGQPHGQGQQQQQHQQRPPPRPQAPNPSSTSVEGQYDDDDHEADLIWAAIDERLQNRRKPKSKKRAAADALNLGPQFSDDPRARERAKIQHSFRDVKQELSKVSEEAWMNLPDAKGDHSLKHKRAQDKKKGHTFTPLSDSLLESRTTLGRNGGADRSSLSMNAKVNISANESGGGVNMSGIGAARGTVLGMSLDRMSESATTSGLATSVNASGYLTSMSTIDANGAMPNSLGDIHKARLLLKSVRDTNPGHGQGWIASARVEEAAGKTLRARKIIQEGCASCPTFVDVWLEAARLHPLEVAKSILATGVRRVENTVPLFLKAAELETLPKNQKAVLRKALESSPHSLQLWKHAIGLEDTEEGAKMLLGVAVEKVPTAVELWLALARLESYVEAQSTLNKARKALPLEKSIWMAAAKLEESQNHLPRIPKIVDKAFKTLAKKDVVISRQQWITEAEDCEDAGATFTSAAIVGRAIGLGVLDEDRVRTWSDDAKQVLARGHPATARAILAHALQQFPTKRSLWMQAVELETKSHLYDNKKTTDDTTKTNTNTATPTTTEHNETKEGNDAMETDATATITTTTTTTNKSENAKHAQHILNEALDQVLQAASERLPRVEVFWLLRAKEQWLAGSVDVARDILAKAFEANPDSETVWLAAAKLEWENGETERARVLLERARERAPSERVYMKSALLEREVGSTTASLKLIEEGLQKYPKTAPKLYMMGGQICSGDLPNALLLIPTNAATNAKRQKKLKSYLDKARKIYQEGIEQCRSGTDNVTLWILASLLEERAHTFVVAADGIGTEATSTSTSTSTNNSTPTTQQQQQGVTKARSLLELARLQHPGNDRLWLAATRLERRSGNPQLADSLMARALQECPKSGPLLSESIVTAPRVAQKSKSASAIKRNPESPLIITAVAALFAADRKTAKARKWFERAVLLDPDLGDSWARYYGFELKHGTSEQQRLVKNRCSKADPKHGEVWQTTTKAMEHRHKTVEEGLALVVAELERELASRKAA